MRDQVIALVIALALIGWALWNRKQRKLEVAAATAAAAAEHVNNTPATPDQGAPDDHDELREEADYPPAPPTGCGIVVTAILTGVGLGVFCSWLFNLFN